MLGEHKGSKKKYCLWKAFLENHILYFDGPNSWIWRTLGHVMNFFIKWHFHSASNKDMYLQKKIKIDAVVQKYHVAVQYCQIGNFQSGTFAPIHGTF